LIVSHAVTLGIYCDVAAIPYLVSNNLYLECADAEYELDQLFTNMDGVEVSRYGCGTLVKFPAFNIYNSKTIPDVSIVTGDSWLTNTDPSCYTTSISNPTTLVTTEPVYAPTNNVPASLFPTSNTPTGATAPIISTETPAPTLRTSTSSTTLPSMKSPSSADKLPTTAPQTNSSAARISSPVAPRETPKSSSNDSFSSIGPVVGGVVAVVVIVCLLVTGFIIYRKKNKAATIDEKPDPFTSPLPTAPNDFSNGANNVTFESTHQPPEEEHQIFPIIEEEETPIIAAPPPLPRYNLTNSDQSHTFIGQPQPGTTMDTRRVPSFTPMETIMDISALTEASELPVRGVEP
jgi:hypothetical protein